jgi:hypothetical protein
VGFERFGQSGTALKALNSPKVCAGPLESNRPKVNSLITTASFNSRTTKELAEIARKKGIRGWHAMRKEQLVQALIRLERGTAASKKSPPAGAKSRIAARSVKRASKTTTQKSAATAPTRRASTSRPAQGKREAKARVNGAAGKPKTEKSSAPSKKSPQRKNAIALRRIQEDTARREQLKDLALASEMRRRLEAVQKNGQTQNGPGCLPAVKNGQIKDRVVLLVRDSYWLQACWDISRQSVVRAQASMAEHWHTARPILRLIELETGGSTSSAERIVRDTEIHGGVDNWYLDVYSPPQSFRVDIGYLADDGRFHVLARSNTVTTPQPGSTDAVDRNWTDVAENYEKIYALSGGYGAEKGDLQDVFEERLHRPMGSSLGARFGAGAERMLHRDRNFHFEVDAEIIVFGSTKPDAHVNLSGEPVKIRPDGSFAVRLALPDRRQVLPVTASSRDGVEERTIVLAIERNTKIMEPLMHDPNEQ